MNHFAASFLALALAAGLALGGGAVAPSGDSMNTTQGGIGCCRGSH